MIGPGAVLQFGAGNFLRAFLDVFLCERAGRTGIGEVTVVQSTSSRRAAALNAAGGKYHVAVQGVRDGEVVDEVIAVDSIARALVAAEQWREVLAAACAPDLRWIVSNVTEAGLALAPADREHDGVPVSYPAKLLAVLLARCRCGLDGPLVLPCELVENNGRVLRDAVLALAETRGVTVAERAWLREDCTWADTLVDRIVPGPPTGHPLLVRDPLLLATEPYALLAVASARPLELDHPALVRTADVAPWFLRKVRILNGAHTALVAHALPMGIATVGGCLRDPGVASWLEELLFGEIVPVLDGRVEDPGGFARTVLERFANPFHQHALESIALHHETKLATRLRPTLDEYRARFGRTPPILGKLLP